MEQVSFVRLILALAVVIGLIFLAAVALRRHGAMLGIKVPARGRRWRLAIEETIGIDSRRRLALVRCDDEQFLLLLGPGGDTVIGRLGDGLPPGSPPAAAPTGDNRHES